VLLCDVCVCVAVVDGVAVCGVVCCVMCVACCLLGWFVLLCVDA